MDEKLYSDTMQLIKIKKVRWYIIHYVYDDLIFQYEFSQYIGMYAAIVNFPTYIHVYLTMCFIINFDTSTTYLYNIILYLNRFYFVRQRVPSSRNVYNLIVFAKYVLPTTIIYTSYKHRLYVVYIYYKTLYVRLVLAEMRIWRCVSRA